MCKQVRPEQVSSAKRISSILFGTEDYESMLEILPAYDGTVRQFFKQLECEASA